MSGVRPRWRGAVAHRATALAHRAAALALRAAAVASETPASQVRAVAYRRAPTTGARIGVYIVDSRPLLLVGLSALLDSAGWARVLGRSTYAADAADACARLRPDVAIVDLGLPDGHGVDVIGRIRSADPDTRVLALDDTDALALPAVRAGAGGYLLKDADPDEVIRAVWAVAHGNTIIGRAIAPRLPGHLAALAHRSGPFPELTPREHQTLDLLARGLPNRTIADRMGISLKTVRNLVSVVLAKLRVADRPAAIVRAREAGLGAARR